MKILADVNLKRGQIYIHQISIHSIQLGPMRS